MPKKLKMCRLSRLDRASKRAGDGVIKIPASELSEDALLGVIDAFILREGADYGHRDIPFAEKRERVLEMLASGAAEIRYFPETDHIDIVLTA